MCLSIFSYFLYVAFYVYLESSSTLFRADIFRLLHVQAQEETVLATRVADFQPLILVHGVVEREARAPIRDHGREIRRGASLHASPRAFHHGVADLVRNGQEESFHVRFCFIGGVIK